MRLNPFGAQRIPSHDKAAIAAPIDPRKMPPGPSQLAGHLDRAPDKLKGQVLNLQNRPEAFKEGSQPTRMIGGRQVAISAPILGMKVPASGESALASTRASRPHTPAGQTLVAESPARLNGPHDMPHIPALQADQNFQMMHLSQPNAHQTAPYRPPQHANQQGPGKPSQNTGPQGHDLPDAAEEKKGMSTGKKIMIGAAALLGITFLMSGDSSSSSPTGS